MKLELRSLLGGGLIFVIGAGAALIGFNGYNMGTLATPGPGLFPVALGTIVAILGAGIVIRSAARSDEALSFDWRSMLAILGAVIAFALSIRTLGLVPAVTITVLVARLAEAGRYDVVGTLVLAAAASAGTWVIFVLLLDTPIVAFRWPF